MEAAKAVAVEAGESLGSPNPTCIKHVSDDKFSLNVDEFVTAQIMGQQTALRLRSAKEEIHQNAVKKFTAARQYATPFTGGMLPQ